MTQPSLLDLPQPRPRKAVNVPASSVLAYQERPRDARVKFVVNGLAFRRSWRDDNPTSAELADSCYGAWASVGQVLEVRRGLSDALALGLVEHAGTRKCTVSGRTCLTWKVKTR